MFWFEMNSRRSSISNKREVASTFFDLQTEERLPWYSPLIPYWGVVKEIFAYVRETFAYIKDLLVPVFVTVASYLNISGLWLDRAFWSLQWLAFFCWIGFRVWQKSPLGYETIFTRPVGTGAVCGRPEFWSRSVRPQTRDFNTSLDPVDPVKFASPEDELGVDEILFEAMMFFSPLILNFVCSSVPPFFWFL